jgi:hypothetical protein
MSVVPLGTQVVYTNLLQPSRFLAINLRSLQLCFPLSFSVVMGTVMFLKVTGFPPRRTISHHPMPPAGPSSRFGLLMHYSFY